MIKKELMPPHPVLTPEEIRKRRELRRRRARIAAQRYKKEQPHLLQHNVIRRTPEEDKRLSERNKKLTAAFREKRLQRLWEEFDERHGF
jgi:hypothetical protein